MLKVCFDLIRLKLSISMSRDPSLHKFQTNLLVDGILLYPFDSSAGRAEDCSGLVIDILRLLVQLRLEGKAFFLLQFKALVVRESEMLTTKMNLEDEIDL